MKLSKINILKIDSTVTVDTKVFTWMTKFMRFHSVQNVFVGFRLLKEGELIFFPPLCFVVLILFWLS